MEADVVGLVTLSVTLLMHLVATAWWAASITKRVEHIEKWITSNERTAERLSALEQSVGHVGTGVDRIEHLLRHLR